MRYNFECRTCGNTRIVEQPINQPFPLIVCEECGTELKQDFSSHKGNIKIPFHMRSTHVESGLNYKKSKKKRVY